LFVTVFYSILVFIFAELATCFPYAGGPYAYARKGLGPFWGYMAGIVTIIEFLCASSAVAISIGLYISKMVPSLPSAPTILTIYAIFIFINVIGIRAASIMQLALTIITISALMLFLMGTSNSLTYENLFLNTPFVNGLGGILSAIPFAVMLYICIEGISLTAEETKNPDKAMSFGFKSSIITVVILSISIIVFCIASADWKLFIGQDNPLLIVLSQTQPKDIVLITVFTSLALCGLLASLHGIIYGFSRQVFSLSRAGYLPKFLSKIHPLSKAPHLAIILPGIAGMILTQTVNLKDLIAITGFAASIMYILVLFSYIRIEKIGIYHFKNKSVIKQVLVWAALAFGILIFVLFLIQELKNAWNISSVILVVLIYYFAIGRNLIAEDAPEEIEAKVDKIQTKKY
ncbi:MAG TPA: amino acid permease, partial [Anaerovoracaceae bacterium]|nr:amino acid permease [Anaerovoracaceae bacterium]